MKSVNVQIEIRENDEILVWVNGVLVQGVHSVELLSEVGGETTLRIALRSIYVEGSLSLRTGEVQIYPERD